MYGTLVVARHCCIKLQNVEDQDYIIIYGGNSLILIFEVKPYALRVSFFIIYHNLQRIYFLL